MQYQLIRNHNRRHSAALLINPAGEVVVRAPAYMPKFLIDRFVKQHESWITKKLSEKKKPFTPQIAQFKSPESLIKFIHAKLQIHQKNTGLVPGTIRFKKVRTYWGSCATNGDISFNTELLYVPPDVVEYVVVHELCHLKYRGHQKRFWDLMTKYFSNTPHARKALRAARHMP